MKYLLVADSGEIDGHGFASSIDEVVERPGLTIIESAVGERGSHWFDGEEVVEYSAEGKARYANPPGPGFSWAPSEERWIDQRTLEQAQADAWTHIKARRETAFAARAVSSAGIAYSIAADKANLADRLASLQAAIAIGAAGSTTSITWRDRDNAEHALTIAGLNLLAAEMGARGQAIYENSWALDAQVQAATSNAQLESINYEGGWP